VIATGRGETRIGLAIAPARGGGCAIKRNDAVVVATDRIILDLLVASHQENVATARNDVRRGILQRPYGEPMEIDSMWEERLAALHELVHCLTHSAPPCK